MIDDKLKDILVSVNDSPTQAHFRLYDSEIAQIKQVFKDAGWGETKEKLKEGHHANDKTSGQATVL